VTSTNNSLRLALGARMDNIAKADLLARVEELTGHNTELAVTAAQQRANNDTLRARVTELEDDLAAARTSLRRMIRTENLPPDADNAARPKPPPGDVAHADRLLTAAAHPSTRRRPNHHRRR